MKSSYTPWRALWKYLGGTAASRAGDEMTGPALLLLGFAVTGRPATGSALLAGLTVAAAVGGPLFGALLDRSPRPDRVLALKFAARPIDSDQAPDCRPVAVCLLPLLLPCRSRTTAASIIFDPVWQHGGLQ